MDLALRRWELERSLEKMVRDLDHDLQLAQGLRARLTILEAALPFFR